MRDYLLPHFQGLEQLPAFSAFSVDTEGTTSRRNRVQAVRALRMRLATEVVYLDPLPSTDDEEGRTLDGIAQVHRRRRARGGSMKTGKPLVLFAGLPIVLKNLRGNRTVREVAAGTGLALEHLVLLEHRPSRQYGSRVLEERTGRIPRLDTLDSLLRYHGISLSDLEAFLTEVQAETDGLPIPPKKPSFREIAVAQPGLDLEDPHAVLDFLKGEPLTVQELKDRLESAQGQEWCRLAGMVLRQAPPEDALQFVSRQEIADRWEALAEHLGSRRELWRWFLETPGERPRTGYGTFFSLTAWFWKAQGLSTWTAHALAAAGLRSWQEIESMSRKDLARLRFVGRAGRARIEELLALRGRDPGTR